MNKNIYLYIILLLLSLIIGCIKEKQNQFNSNEASKLSTNESKEQLMINSTKNNEINNLERTLLERLKSIEEYFSIIIWEKSIEENRNPLGFIKKDSKGNIFGDAGLGFASCNILNINDNTDRLYFKVEAIYCVNIYHEDNLEKSPNCNKYRIVTCDFILDKNDVELLEKDYRLDIICNVILEKFVTSDEL